MEFENYNGKLYKVLKQEGNYTLLKQKEEVNEPYVVAFLLELDEENKGEWNQGRYYGTLESAESAFEEKIK